MDAPKTIRVGEDVYSEKATKLLLLVKKALKRYARLQLAIDKRRNRCSEDSMTSQSISSGTCSNDILEQPPSPIKPFQQESLGMRNRLKNRRSFLDLKSLE